MYRPRITALLAIALLGGVAFSSGFAADASAEPQERIEFNRDIRPILSDNCFFCHGPDANHREADLRLDVAENALEDRGGYRAIVPGRPEESVLIERLTAEDSAERMPPVDSGKQLSPAQIDVLRRWIAEGADYQSHWSYLPLVRHPVPAKSNDWSRNIVDQFLWQQMTEAGIAPAEQADRVTLVRRLYLDLIGLPPTQDEAQQFLEDARPDAFERLVDRLLASPHFGERMAVYWLDLVRYADTVGYHGDQEHHISPYRDYVIRAFNDNVPFDQFTREQLAGDLLPEPTQQQLVATGYNRVLQTSHEGGVQVKEYLAKYSADRVRNLGSVWLGATVACAECHNHKFDPYTQRDFYRLAAFFADVDDLQTFKADDKSPTRRAPEMPVFSAQQLEQLKPLRARLSQFEQQLASVSASAASSNSDAAAEVAAVGEQATREDVGKAIDELKAQIAAIENSARRTMITVAIEPREIRVLNRGDWMDTSGEVVEPGVPDFLPPLQCQNSRPTRLDLANWLTSPDHPLTSRVFVNRMWYLLFGQGLCTTLDDLGSQGDQPIHSALLDELALDFVHSGWDVKRLIRRIVTSSAYRQSALASDEAVERDPQNRLFARQAVFRLQAEFVRDNALAVSGLLETQVEGPSARPYQPDGYYQFLNFPKRTYHADTGSDQYRRGVYVHWQRQFLHPMLRAFDAPTREECTARRAVSNTPLAALTMLNDPSMLEAARVLAQRTLNHAGPQAQQRAVWMFQQVLTREAEDEEMETLLGLLQRELQQYAERPDAARQAISVGQAPITSAVQDDAAAVELAAWTSVARVLLNLHETITRR